MVPLVKDPPVPEILIAQTEKEKLSTLTRYVNLSIFSKGNHHSAWFTGIRLENNKCLAHGCNDSSSRAGR